ncbi:MAG: hypothetical protein KTR29_18935 [Rhodothermaceae bacterium]|nr:hypothetical protein [Rhodothermaceae bacterium]
MRITFGIVVFCFAWCIQPSFAQEVEQSAEEVFWTELVYPQEKGEVQLSLSPWINTTTDPSVGQSPFTLEYGISDAWQLEAEWSGPAYNGSDYESALELGTKYSFLNLFNKGLHVAIGNEFEFAMEGEGVGTEPFAVIAIDLPRLANLHLFSQVKMEFELSEEDNAIQDVDALEEEAAGWSVQFGAILPTEEIYFSAEIGWMQEDKGLQSYVTPGLIFEIIDDFQVGLGIPIGLTSDSDTFRISTFFTYEFELFESN